MHRAHTPPAPLSQDLAGGWRGPSARDTLRVVVRDRRGVVVNDVGGEVTRGDLATVVVR
jgi:hypothetical protein